MNVYEVVGVTINIGFLAIIYTILGGLVSYVFYYLIDEFDEDWKKKSVLFKVSDVSIELAIIGITTFWVSMLIEKLPQIVPLKKKLDTLVDGYMSGVFFLFAIFIFIDSLTDKIKFLYDEHVGPSADVIFPQYGSIIDLSLSYTPKRTDLDKLKNY